MSVDTGGGGAAAAAGGDAGGGVRAELRVAGPVAAPPALRHPPGERCRRHRLRRVIFY